MMSHSPILKACLICLCITACESQQPPSPVIKTTEPQTAPEKTHLPLDLSIENIAIESLKNNDAAFLNDKMPTEENSKLFETLNKEQTEPNIDISGKIFTDEEKLKDKEYLDSVEGVQINVEGKLE